MRKPNELQRLVVLPNARGSATPPTNGPVWLLLEPPRSIGHQKLDTAVNVSTSCGGDGLAGLLGEGVDIVSRYASVADQKGCRVPGHAIVQAAEVSTRGFYDWCSRERDVGH